MAATSHKSAFLKAAYDGDLVLLKRLASETRNAGGLTKAYEKVTDAVGRNSLHFAAAVGNTQICKFLVVKLKFDVDWRDKLGNTPLIVAIMEQRHPTAVYLIENGAGIECQNHGGSTALHYAAEKGQTEMLRLLLSKGAKAIIGLNSSAGTPLQRATLYAKTESVKILLANGVDVNSFTKRHSPPLMLSVISGSYECMELLLKAGADPNLGHFGKTPLILAATVLDARFIKHLLKAGANPNVVDTTGVTALELAALCGNVTGVINLYPCTCRISYFPDWSVNGIMKHIYSEVAITQREIRRKNDLEVLKAKGREAFVRNDYEEAMLWYSQAMCADPADASVLSNRSLCWAMLKLGGHALEDAEACVGLKPDWPKAHYRKGAALMLLHDYSKALEAFSLALMLDPNNNDIKKAHREALEAQCVRTFSNALHF